MASMLTSSYAFGSIIDIYNFDSTTGAGLGVHSPMDGPGQNSDGNRVIYRAQSKLSSILQTYFYNLAPSPWSPPTIYLSLHRELEALEDILHQLGNYEFHSGLGILDLVTHGLFDLLQEVELLLMSSRVDGNRNERWWDRFAKGLKDGTSRAGGEEAFIKARENVKYFVWAGRWVLRVTVHGEYTRRITVAGDKLEKMLVKLCEEQLALYVWDGADGDDKFDITVRFEEMASYEGGCFIGKVKLEAVLRVWMIWAHKAVVSLKSLASVEAVSPKGYLDLLKAGWLFKLFRDDQRFTNSSDELRAVVALVCNDLVFTLKSLVEQWQLPHPEVADLVAQGEWRILMEEGFEEWELEVEDEIAKQLQEHRAQSQTYITSANIKDVTPSPGFEKELQGVIEDGIDFRYSPVIMRSDDEDEIEPALLSATIKTPLAQPQLPVYEHNIYSSSHASLDSMESYYSEYTDAYFSSANTSDQEDSNSPNLRSMMTPVAAPGSAYEMYDQNPYDVSDDSDEGVTTSASKPEEKSEASKSESPKPIMSNKGGSNHTSSGPVGSRFREHLSIQAPSKPLPIIPPPRRAVEGGSRQGSLDRLDQQAADGQSLSPLSPPPAIIDPSGAAKPTRFPRPAVGGTMSSAGGHAAKPLSTPLKTSVAALATSTGSTATAAPSPANANSTSTQKVAPSRPPPPPPQDLTQATGGLGVPTTTLAVPGTGLAGKETTRTIPAPLHLGAGKKIAKALKTARQDIHEKGGWTGLLTPMSGNREKNSPGFSPVSSAGLLTSRRIDSPSMSRHAATPVQPLTVSSGAVVAVNQEVPRGAIKKDHISSPTPACAGLPTPTPQPKQTPKIQRKPTVKAPKPRVVKNTAARRTAEAKKTEYDIRKGELEIMPTEFAVMGALASDTGLPSGKWDECVIRLFRKKDGKFRIVTFRDNRVDDEYVDSSNTELVPEYAHHMHETVPIIFIRRITERSHIDGEGDEKHKSGKSSARSSFACVGTVNNGPARLGNAESFYYRFRRIDDMFNFQMAWLGEMVMTDIHRVKSIRYKRGLVASECITGRARVQIWKEQPDVHEHGKVGGTPRVNGRVTGFRIVLYWDEVICTMFINESLDIEAKSKTQTLKLRAAQHRTHFNPHIRAKIIGQQYVTTPASVVPGQITATTSGGVNLDKDALGGFSDESQFDDFKWFEIEFFERDEMKWLYQDFMQCQNERMRQLRNGSGGGMHMGNGDGGSHRREKSGDRK